MFQYAMARRYAHVNQAELLLYLGARYKSGSHRVYGLNKFRTAGRVATEAEAGGLRRIKRTRSAWPGCFLRSFRPRTRNSSKSGTCGSIRLS